MYLAPLTIFAERQGGRVEVFNQMEGIKTWNNGKAKAGEDHKAIKVDRFYKVRAGRVWCWWLLLVSGVADSIEV